MRSPHTGDKIRIPLTEYLKSIPEMVGLRVNEEPKYEVVVEDGDFEIRRYAPMQTATVTMSGTGQEGRGEAFRRLAAYIFGENAEGKALAMTSPVFQDAEERMTFVLPRSVRRAGAPQPVDPGIEITLLPQRLMAVVRYSGEDSDDQYALERSRLESWLAGQARYRFFDEAVSAEYDPPSSLDATKRNEVQIEVTEVQ